MTARISDLEAPILSAWSIIDDITLLVAEGAGAQDILKLADVYQFKFNNLWTAYSEIIRMGTSQQPDPVSSSTTGGEASFVDDDGHAVSVSYKNYDGDWILGIDTPHEGLSVCLQDLDKLNAALQKVSEYPV